MSEYLKDDKFLQELHEINKEMRQKPNKGPLLLSDDEYEEQEASGSGMARFKRLSDLQHISHTIARILRAARKP